MDSNFALHQEVKRGHTARVRELLHAATGLEGLNSTDRAGYTPLMYALLNPAAPLELVTMLLDHGATTIAEQMDGFPCTIVSVCLHGGDPEKLALLLDRGADAHYRSAYGSNAVIDAACRGTEQPESQLLDVLRLLLAQGVAPDRIGIGKKSALGVLSRYCRFAAVRLLLDAGADEAQLAWTPLHHAVALGTFAELQALLEEAGGADLEAREQRGRTPWLVAIQTGDVEKARYLLSRGADSTVTGLLGASPLNYAVAKNNTHTPMLKWLIEIGISVESTRDNSVSPLGAAVKSGSIEAVDVLIAAGADVNRTVRFRSPPALTRATSREMILHLLDAGADPTDLPFKGHRVLLGLESPQPTVALFDATPEQFRGPHQVLGPTQSRKSRSPVLAGHDPLRHLRRGGRASRGRRSRRERPDPVRQPLRSIAHASARRSRDSDWRRARRPYDSNHCIYNDVFVHHPDGRIEVFCYPESVFPPTDFHTATLVGHWIYLIGGLGNQGHRRIGITPVYRLDTNTLKIERVEANGGPPGRLYRHRAVFLADANTVRVWGGKLSPLVLGTATSDQDHLACLFDVAQHEWREERGPA